MKKLAILSAVLSLVLSARPLADEPAQQAPISGDESLNQSMAQYRQLQPEWGVWKNPYLPEASASKDAAVAQFGESGDQAMTRMLAQYGRAEMDRGGWENPFAPSAAAGNSLFAAQIGSGVTLGPNAEEQASGDELLARIVSVYTRTALDRGGWENPFAPSAAYAAGNALLAVSVGEGVALLASR